MHDKSAPDRSAVRTDAAEPATGRPVRERMTALERRATASLAGIYGLRMLGMFIILPVFALYAETLPGGRDHTLVGIALGAYGLTQAILQIPFGWASDRYGRKPTIVVGLLLFAFGSFVAAWAPNIWWTIAGRSMQGAGAISAAVIALTADLTRHEVRTRAMAAIGMTIGATFALSLILGPVLKAWIGVPGIFALTGVLALGAIVVLKRRVPDPDPAHVHPREPGLAAFGKVLADGQLLRLNYGIFALHALLMALFVQVPFALRDAGLVAEAHWKVYLPVMVGSVLLMLPLLRAADRPARSKAVFMGAVLMLLVGQVVLALAGSSLPLLVAGPGGVLRRVQPARGDAAVARVQVRAAGTEGHGHRCLFERAVPGRVPRRRGRRLSRPARRPCRRVRAGDRADGRVARGQRHDERPAHLSLHLFDGRNLMASVNKVILLGNLGRDPETRYTTGGDAVTNLRIATSEQWKDKSGEKQERTEWHTRRAVRTPGRDRRRVPEEGPLGLHRGPAADAQVHGQGRRGEVLDRDRRRSHAADRQRARRRGWRRR